MSYPEIVDALQEELDVTVKELEVFEEDRLCEHCGESTHFGYLGLCLHHFICADRPACRERAARQRDERERAVVDAVKL